MATRPVETANAKNCSAELSFLPSISTMKNVNNKPTTDGVSHDSSVGKLTVCPPFGPGSISSQGRVFQGIFPWLITLCQPVLSQHGRKWLKLPSMTPHNPWAARRKAVVQPWIERWPKEKNRRKLPSGHDYRFQTSAREPKDQCQLCVNSYLKTNSVTLMV